VRAYIDSSVLVAVYVPERFSPVARRIVQDVQHVPFTALHDLEVHNAFELLVGRHLISPAECDAIRGQLQEDVETRRLASVALDIDQVYLDAVKLSRLYSAKFLTRSLDLLHVAAAHALTCTRFVSADDRQLATAKAAGLKVVDIKARRPRRT
jgi:predicted nucleic acid-binding protein